MKQKEITAYFCDHCNKLYQRQHACITHEKRCSKNPDNDRLCWNCMHCSIKYEEFWQDGYSGDDPGTVKVFHCSKLDTFVYPPKVEYSHQGPYDFDYNIPMKNECEHFDNVDNLDITEMWDRIFLND